MKNVSKHLMPNLGTLIILGLFLLMQVTGVLGAPGSTQVADVPTKIGYQGQLTDDTGAPVPDGTYAMHFAIYSTSTGGTALWSEDQNMTVAEGQFDVLLGSVAPLNGNLFDGSQRWLGVQVEADPEMTPRQPLASVPFALRGDVADAAITTAKLAPDAVTADKIANDAVGSGEIINGSVSSDDLGTNAVTTDKLADGNVTAAKLASSAANDNLKSGGHVVLDPDPDKLVKLAVLRQDNTTNSYLDNQVILTGWGVKQGTGPDQMEESVSFGVTFAEPPIVVVNFAGRSTSSDFTAPKGSDWVSQYPYNITTSGFIWRSHKLNGVGHDTGYYFFYTWMAIGTLP
jgi:hypothetical protein